MNALVHAPDRAIIDKSCGRRVTGADTVEERQTKLGELAAEGRWHDDPSPLTFNYGHGTKGRSLGVTDLPYVNEGSTTGSRCMSGKLRLTQQQITAPTSEGESGHHELDLVGSDQDVGGG